MTAIFEATCRPEITDTAVTTKAEDKVALPEQEITTSVTKYWL